MVRIRSKQSLVKVLPGAEGGQRDGGLVEGTDGVKDVDELVVIQRRIMKGKEDAWMVWGTTQETVVDEVLGLAGAKVADKPAAAV